MCVCVCVGGGGGRGITSDFEVGGVKRLALLLPSLHFFGKGGGGEGG